MTSSVQFPPRVAIVDPGTGMLTRDGVQFLRQLFARAGGNVALTNIELGHALDAAHQLAGLAMMTAGAAEAEDGMVIPGPPGGAGPQGPTGATGQSGPTILPEDPEETFPIFPNGPPAGVLVGTQALLSAGATPGTAPAGQLRLFAETGKKLTQVDDAGRTTTMGGVTNYSTSAQGAGFAADTYVVGSAVTIPASLHAQVGTQYRVRISLSKTAAGIATPIATLRIGTNGSTADAAVITFTGAAQTAVADVGVLEFFATFRAVGASAVVQATHNLKHHKANGAGLAGTEIIEVTSGTFDSTTASLVIGVSLNFGTSAAITVTLVQAELTNI